MRICICWFLTITACTAAVGDYDNVIGTFSSGKSDISSAAQSLQPVSYVLLPLEAPNTSTACLECSTTAGRIEALRSDAVAQRVQQWFVSAAGDAAVPTSAATRLGTLAIAGAAWVLAAVAGVTPSALGGCHTEGNVIPITVCEDQRLPPLTAETLISLEQRSGTRGDYAPMPLEDAIKTLIPLDGFIRVKTGSDPRILGLSVHFAPLKIQDLLAHHPSATFVTYVRTSGGKTFGLLVEGSYLVGRELDTIVLLSQSLSLLERPDGERAADSTTKPVWETNWAKYYDDEQQEIDPAFEDAARGLRLRSWAEVRTQDAFPYNQLNINTVFATTNDSSDEFYGLNHLRIERGKTRRSEREILVKVFANTPAGRSHAALEAGRVKMLNWLRLPELYYGATETRNGEPALIYEYAEGGLVHIESRQDRAAVYRQWWFEKTTGDYAVRESVVDSIDTIQRMLALASLHVRSLQVRVSETGRVVLIDPEGIDLHNTQEDMSIPIFNLLKETLKSRILRR